MLSLFMLDALLVIASFVRWVAANGITEAKSLRVERRGVFERAAEVGKLRSIPAGGEA
jgi:hypothetical protein